MATWKARFRLHVCCNYKAKRVKTRCYQEGVHHFEPRFQREDVPCQYTDITRKAIDCATTVPLTIFI